MELMEEFENELFRVAAGSQRAAKRARVLTIRIQKRMREFRKYTLEHTRKK